MFIFFHALLWNMGLRSNQSPGYSTIIVRELTFEKYAYNKRQHVIFLLIFFFTKIRPGTTTILGKIVAQKLRPYSKIIPHSPVTMLKHEIVFFVI